MTQDTAILDELRGFPETSVAAGARLIEEGGRSGKLIFLIEGEMSVVKDDVVIDVESTPGSVYGEMSILLDLPHTAEVRASAASRVIVLQDPEQALLERPRLLFHICRVLASRLASATRYLVDVKRQFADAGDHLGMVDGVLNTLMHRNPKSRSRRAVREDH